MSSTRTVVIPRCETCNGKFHPKEKVFCVECNKKIHYECAVYEYDDNNENMLCLDCYKNSKIEKALVRDGIICKVEGDDLCRAYIGSSFLIDQSIWDKKINILEEYNIDLGVVKIEDNDCCKFCGWRSEYEQSHIDYGNWNCSHIVANYNLKFDEDGNLEWTKKDEPDCAFGYCNEELYKRGCLKSWKNKWLCEDCKITSGLECSRIKKKKKVRKFVCGRVDKYGDKCEEIALSNNEFCGRCMEIECGMYNEDE